MSRVSSVRLIMPVASDQRFSERKDAFTRAITRCGYEPIFPSYSPKTEDFDIAKFLKELQMVEMVIADLTLERPSCYYELGIVEAVGKLVHLVAEMDTRIHQCAGRKAVIFYEDTFNLIDIIETILKG